MKQSNGVWYSVLASDKYYYSNGILAEENYYKGKETGHGLTSIGTYDGLWESIPIAGSSYYPNGDKKSEYSTIVNSDAQSWHISSKTTKEWYDNGQINKIETYTAVYKNNEWELELSSIEEWDYNGKKLQ